MFENIIEQTAAAQLKNDITDFRLAPSMLFYGPSESGKGSAALELARVLSCENSGEWKCACSACGHHRMLQHSDLLTLGNRSFAAEISAGSAAFLRNPETPGARLLFIRSVRKLQTRFSPVLMEDDPKAGKLVSVLQSLEEDLNEFIITSAAEPESGTNKPPFEKLTAFILKNALTLANDGIGSTIPIGQIRKSVYWCRLAPNGKRKTLIIENADNMRDEARNSLLKLLEEPPETVSIILTSLRREAIMPTILSRLRPYRFLKRSEEGEREILRRVFQVTPDLLNEEKSGVAGKSLLTGYLDSFLSGGTEKLYPLAAWFVASIARITAASVKKQGKPIPWFISALGERYAPEADAAGFERSLKSSVIVKKIAEEAGGADDSFTRFLKICLDMVCAAAREAKDPQFIAYNETFKKYVNEADTAVNILNINAALALESLLHKIKKEFAADGGHG